jgi:hypothetical protein
MGPTGSTDRTEIGELFLPDDGIAIRNNADKSILQRASTRDLNGDAREGLDLQADIPPA